LNAVLDKQVRNKRAGGRSETKFNLAKLSEAYDALSDCTWRLPDQECCRKNKDGRGIYAPPKKKIVTHSDRGQPRLDNDECRGGFSKGWRKVKC